MSNKQHVDAYVNGMTQFDIELGNCMRKAQVLTKLTDTVMCTKDSPDRNKTLECFVLIKSLRSTLSNIEKNFKATQKTLENVILGMLEVEKLDNFSHNGKLFYPSSTTRFNVSDRTNLEEYIMSLGQEGLELLGNSLNSEYIKNYIETNTQTNEEGVEIPAPPPPGVGTYTTTSLNMRTKK